MLLLSAWAGRGISKANDPLPARESSRSWALEPLSDPVPPSPAGLPESWAANLIDRFVFESLAANGLAPSPPADRRALVRRATYDLTGLPPTPEETGEFLGDSRPDAYEHLIDRLLASPRYGEQWGRHWLDVVRFGESRGFERNEIITNAWPFRDYVIRSFNDDKPFDRLVLEHLAGDLLAKEDPAAEIGSAFLVLGPYDDVGNQDAAQARIIRANTIDEVITATSSAFLGLTIGCARCHNHKFDPVTAEDYYRLYAVFAGVHHGDRALTTSAEQSRRDAQVAPLEKRRKAAEDALQRFEAELRERAAREPQPDAFPLPRVHPYLTEDRFEPVEALLVRLNIESNDRNPRDGGNARIDELEVWTSGPDPRNVALASSGARVEGPARRAEDFAEAYAPSLVIDGRYGARWISPGPGSLTISFPQPQKIDRISFSADRQRALPEGSGEIVFVGEYTIEVSPDGKAWSKVADSRARPPLGDAFRMARAMKAIVTAADRERLATLGKAVEEARAAVAAVPSLPTVWAGRFQQPESPLHVFVGGDPSRLGPEVRPGSLSALSGVLEGFELPADAPEAERRLALARWIVSPGNPLTPRVMANRLWHYHFGTGLVDTPSDFGKLGGEPTHPELLDWLALRLESHGWKLKALHREIVLSQTYRQSSAWRQEAADIDAGSRLLWRYPPRRLSAEELRDTMLADAGVLDTTPYGPGFRLYRYLQDNVATYLPLDQHGPETYRRAVYHHNARATVVDLMTEFDLPDCAFPAPKRAATTSPLQALSLLNHSFTLDMASALGARIEREVGGTEPRALARRAFELVLGRAATELELEDSSALVRDHGVAALARGLFNASELLYIE